MQSFLQFLHKLADQVQPAYQWLRETVLSLLASPDRWIVYTAAVWIALLLIFIPLFRISSRRRRRREEFEEVRSYSVLGIGPGPSPNRPEINEELNDVIRPVRSYPRWADTAPAAPPVSPLVQRPASKQGPAVERPITELPSNVTPIRPSITVNCTHCGSALSARQDFCPACGYAQPANHSVTA
jgi:hypothetical protein